MIWVALAMVITQSVLIGVLLWLGSKGLVKLGEFTDATLGAHKSNVLLVKRVEYAVDQIGIVKQLQKVDNELAAERAASFVFEDEEKSA